MKFFAVLSLALVLVFSVMVEAQMKGMPEIPKPPTMPGIPKPPAMPGMPGMPEMPKPPAIPGAPKMPGK